jgi:CheY-like chemotaxis protein
MRSALISALNVLVADDERIIADTLALILNQSGYRASAVYSGEQALQAAAESTPHVLISDVVMGGMNGIEAALAILRMCPQCHVILFSGQAVTTDLLARHAVAHQFEILVKPVHPKAILECLKAIEANVDSMFRSPW